MINLKFERVSSIDVLNLLNYRFDKADDVYECDFKLLVGVIAKVIDSDKESQQAFLSIELNYSTVISMDIASENTFIHVKDKLIYVMRHYGDYRDEVGFYIADRKPYFNGLDNCLFSQENTYLYMNDKISFDAL